MSAHPWPTLNAALNGTSAVLLILGFLFIRRRKIAAHRACMLAAFCVSGLFLGCYLYYHSTVRTHTPFRGTGWLRPLYFAILLSHTSLAIMVLPLALLTLRQAARGQFAAHRRIARWTWPIWVYVSLTGVIVYWMLYQLP